MKYVKHTENYKKGKFKIGITNEYPRDTCLYSLK